MKRLSYSRLSRFAIALIAFFGCAMTVGFAALQSPRAIAQPTHSLNFQARLLQASGAVATDGYYNVEFKLFNASTSTGSSQGSCTGDPACLWTETYHDANGPTAGSDNRLRVVNGYLTVNLGSLTAFPTINWDQDLYLTMNVGGTTQTTTPTWDGEMTPRLKLTSVPYAFQSKSASQLQQSQGTFNGALSFGTLTQNRTISLPDEDGTLCIQNSSTCGFMTGNPNDFIQNNSTLTPQTADINITGSTTIGTNFTQTGAGTFTTGTGAVTINGNTTISGTNTFTVGTGTTTLGGTLSVAGETTVSNNLTVQGSGSILGVDVDGGIVQLGDAATSVEEIVYGNMGVQGAASSASLAVTSDTLVGGALQIQGGSLATAGVSRLTSAGVLQNVSYEGEVIGIAYGGTGVTATPTDGQLLIGNGTGYTLATLTEGNGISITNGSGVITIGTVGSAGNGAVTLQSSFGAAQTGNLNVTGVGRAGTVLAETTLQTSGGLIVSGVSTLQGNLTVQASSGSILHVDVDDAMVTYGSTTGADTFTKLANPSSLPAGSGGRTAFSQDGQYMSVAHSTSPYITIYKRSGDTFTKLADPTTLPTGAGYSVAWSPDGTYMSVAHGGSPFVTIYKRSGDTFTKLANPTTLPTGGGYDVVFSPDGQYMSVAHSTSPYITIYKRSGDTFTKLANPTTLPTGAGYSVAWSPDGTYMSVAHGGSPFVTIYKRSGDTFTKLANPTTLPTGGGYDVVFSPDGQYMSVAHSTSPYITIYKRSGDTFTKLANPTTLPTGAGYSVAWSPDGTYMSVAHGGSPFVTIYKRSGDTFTKLANPATLPAGNAVGTAFSPDGQYMSVAHATSPYITIYKRGFVNQTVYGSNATTGTISAGSVSTTGNINASGDLSVGGATSLGGALEVVGTTTISSSLQVQSSAGEAILDVNPDMGTITIGQDSIGDTFTKIADPINLPTGISYATAFSSDGQYMSVAHDTSPYITIYKRSGDTFTKLANPSSLPPNASYSTAWPPDGTYLVVGHGPSGYITIYKRSGDTFTKLANPASLPAGYAWGVSFSPDGQYMSVAHSTSPYITIYKRSGDTFTKLANPASLPALTGNDVAFSPDGQYMSVANNPFGFFNLATITIYKRSGDTFTKLANPATLPTGVGYGTAWSPDGQYMSVAHSTSPYITIYKRSGDTFTKLADPASLPAGTVRSVSFSPDSSYLSVASTSSPYTLLYKRSGDTFTKLANPATLPAGAGYGTSWSSDGRFVSVSHATSPYITIYKRGGVNQTNHGSLSVVGSVETAGLAVSGTMNVGTLSANSITAGSLGVDRISTSELSLGGSAVFCGAGVNHTIAIRGMTAGGCTAIGTGTLRATIAADSSLRYKHDIQNIAYGLDQIMGMRPVSFVYNGINSQVQLGLIAEELATIAPEAVQYDNEGRPDAIYYDMLTPIIIKAIQQQRDLIDNIQLGHLNTLQSITISGNATFTGDITLAGHLITTGATPTITIANTTQGSSATATIDGNDTLGTITYTTGGSVASNEHLTITFATAYGDVPRVLVGALNAKASQIKTYPDGVTSAGFTISFKDLAPYTTYKLSYFIAQ